MRRRTECALVGLALALLVLGGSVRMLTAPFVTTALVDHAGSAQFTGLGPTATHELAQQVRAYVTGANAGPLPESVGGRAGFSADAVAHLDDVRTVLRLAGWVTLALAAAVAAWVASRLRGGRRDLVARAMRFGAAWSTGLTGLAALVAAVDFDRFFAGFHALFFEAGTWQFPAADLLIQLFPEAFWSAAGVAWGALVVAGALALALGARAVGNDVEQGSSAGSVSDE